MLTYDRAQQAGRRLVVVGLDCVPPRLAFDRFRGFMPVLSGLIEAGLFGELRSTTPPITVPAWASMTSGRDPGELGVYGFRNRIPGSYGLKTATSRDIRAKRIWDVAGEAGKRVSSLFVPPNHPPTPVRGSLLSCFMHDPGQPFSFPPSLGKALEQQYGSYIPDVSNFRTEEKEAALETLYAMGKQHFAIAKTLWKQENPDFMMMVEIGPDRLHHLLWRHFDVEDPRHDPTNPWRGEGERYYRFLDAQLGELLDTLASDTVVMIVSDHGARPMEGGVRINQVLLDAGLLRLKHPAENGTPLSLENIDWANTRAYGAGGYYGRICFNLRGRDPEGCVDFGELAELRETIATLFSALPRTDGSALPVTIQTADELYAKVTGFPPDLFLFFDDLAYRALGTFMAEEHIAAENDTGADGCNHDWNGIFVLSGPDLPQGRVEGLSIMDVFPTALSLLGMPPVDGLQGINRA